MLNIIGKRKIYLTVSAALVLASWLSLVVFGLNLGRDFTGGSLLEVREASGVLSRQEVQEVVEQVGIKNAQVTAAGQGGAFLIRMESITEETHQKLLSELRFSLQAKNKDAALEEVRFESIGPVVGKELQTKALKAIIIALVAIVLYIAWAFRKVSKPIASWKYGVAAIIALVHDISIPTGLFTILGKIVDYEIDALFVTALLTVLGFSVHDTIVVFDRIRENLLRRGGKDFEETANQSVNETLARSINTSLTTILVLTALYVFGGDSTKHFVLVLIVGIFFGTYSSIFVASPLLVIWNKLSRRR